MNLVCRPAQWQCLIKFSLGFFFVPAEAGQPRHGFILHTGFQRAAAKRQIHASSVLLQRAQGRRHSAFKCTHTPHNMCPSSCTNKPSSFWFAPPPRGVFGWVCVCVCFSCWVTNGELCVYQINRFHKAEDRAVLITDRHLYKMDPLKQYKPMKSIPLYNVWPSTSLTACFFITNSSSWTEGGSLDACVKPFHRRRALLHRNQIHPRFHTQLINTQWECLCWIAFHINWITSYTLGFTSKWNGMNHITCSQKHKRL